MSGSIGDNSINSAELQAFISRIENLESEKRAISDDILEIYKEARGTGYDPKIMRKIVALRKMDRQKRIEEQIVLDCYLSALGELATTPLGRAAVERDFG